MFHLCYGDVCSGGDNGSDRNHCRSYGQPESAFELAVTVACLMEHVFWIIIISQFFAC